MKISVYITSYNQRRWLGEAIESILRQTLRPSQIIIIDDCSEDDSRELISGFASCYPELITPVFHSRNEGISQTRIDALQEVTGDYVTYVDGDDRFLSEKLEREANVLSQSSDAAIAFSNNFYISAEGKRIGTWSDVKKPNSGDLFLQTFARDFPKGNLFRMELVNYHAWRAIGFHDPNLHMYEDFDMRIRLTKHLRTVYVDEPLSEIRMHNLGLSKLPHSEHLRALDYIYKKNQHLLSDQSLEKRAFVRQRLSHLLAWFARRAARESLKANKHPSKDLQQTVILIGKMLRYNVNYVLQGLILSIAYRMSA